MNPFAIRWFAKGMSWFMPWYMRTLELRMTDYEPGSDPAERRFTGPVVFVLWHENILMPTTTRRGCDLTLLIGAHRDGTLLDILVSALGFKSVRGSSSRGGLKAILRYIRDFQGTSLVITPDGPRGPRRVLSSGCIQLCSMLQVPIIPVGMAYHNPWRWPSWDRFALPKPGSRGRAVMGRRITIPRRLTPERLEAYRQHVEDTLNLLNAEAESWAMDGLPRERERGLFPVHQWSLDPIPLSTEPS